MLNHFGAEYHVELISAYGTRIFVCAQHVETDPLRVVCSSDENAIAIDIAGRNIKASSRQTTRKRAIAASQVQDLAGLQCLADLQDARLVPGVGGRGIRVSPMIIRGDMPLVEPDLIHGK